MMDDVESWMVELIGKKVSCFWEPVQAFVFAFVIWASCGWGVDVFVCNKERFYDNLQQLCKTILDYTTQTMYIHICRYRIISCRLQIYVCS